MENVCRVCCCFDTKETRYVFFISWSLHNEGIIILKHTVYLQCVNYEIVKVCHDVVATVVFGIHEFNEVRTDKLDTFCSKCDIYTVYSYEIIQQF